MDLLQRSKPLRYVLVDVAEIEPDEILSVEEVAVETFDFNEITADTPS